MNQPSLAENTVLDLQTGHPARREMQLSYKARDSKQEKIE